MKAEVRCSFCFAVEKDSDEFCSVKCAKAYAQWWRGALHRRRIEVIKKTSAARAMLKIARGK